MNRFLYPAMQAWAGLRKKPGFMAVVVSTMGITLGTLLCVLTLAHVLIVSPLPYPDQEHLYQLEYQYHDPDGKFVGSHFTYPGAIELYRDKSVFSESALSFYSERKLVEHALRPIVRTTYVTPEWFSLLGATMKMGRRFEQSEEMDSDNPVAILSYEAWQEYFSGDPGILGQTVRFGSVAYRIVGVLSKSFIEPQLYQLGKNTHVFMPWDFNDVGKDRRHTYFNAPPELLFFGKLSSSESQQRLEDTLTSVANGSFQEAIIGSEFLNGYRITMKLNSMKSAVLRDSELTVYLLLAGVAGLVLIALVNIANQFISRTAEKYRELAIHASLGARKSDVFKVLLAESGLLMLMSMLLALLVAFGGLYVIQHLLMEKLPRVDELAVSGVTLSVALVVAVAVALLFARISANMIDYRTLQSALQSSGKGTGAQVSKKIRQLLIISQVAVVTLLVFISLSILQEALRVINQPLGFDTGNTSTLYLTGAAESAEALVPAVTEIGKRLEQLPEVQSVSHAFSPLDLFDTPAHTTVANNENLLVQSLPVDHRYFALIGQTLREGDFFSEADSKDQARVIIINQEYAEHLVPGGSALGEQIQVNGAAPHTVIGVVQGITVPGDDHVPMRAYYPWPEHKYRLRMLVKLRKGQTMPTADLVAIIEEVGVGGQVGYGSVESWGEKRNRLLFTQHTTALTSAVLALLSFVLAAVGLYGILSYSTQLRRFELGTRMALGAKRHDLIRMIINDNGRPLLMGGWVSLAALVALFAGFSDQLSHFVNLQVLMTFAMTVLMVASISLLACYWPLRQFINKPAIHSLRGSQ